MPDYSQGKIYTITTEKGVYVGSTTRSLRTRLSGHLSALKIALKGKSSYCSSFEVLHGATAAIAITLVEEYPCSSRIELGKREAEIIKRTACVNRRCSGRLLQHKTPLHKKILALSKDECRPKMREYANARVRKNPAVRELARERSRQYYAKMRENPVFRELARERVRAWQLRKSSG